MKNILIIKDMSSSLPTRYMLAGKAIEIPGLGTYRELLCRVWDSDIDKEFKLATITQDFIYYIDENESDDTAFVVMINRELKLVSDNFLAANDLTGIVIENKELLWCSPPISRWQQEQNGDDSVNL